MGQFGFSYVGLIFMLMLTIPNLIWTKHKPKGYTAANENKLLSILESIGQVCVTCIVLVFKNFNLRPFTPWSLWLIAACTVMLVYEAYWIHYFCGEKTLDRFYGSFLGVPVPGATLPIIGFFLLGIYGKSILLLISITILGIGHIGIHLQHNSELKKTSQS